VLLLTRGGETAPEKAPSHAEETAENKHKEKQHKSEAAEKDLAASDVSASSAHGEESKGTEDVLKARILALEEEKRRLLEEQVNSLKRQQTEPQAPVDAMAGNSGVISADKKCQLSGDPAKRKDELRACFGIPTAEERAALSPHATAAHDPGHWEYSGQSGPEYWGQIKPEFRLCETGLRQSPINIVGKTRSGAPKLSFQYRVSPLKLINNGHTIQANYGGGSNLLVNGEPFELVQFHFHTPSEEWVQGRASDLVVHLVHKNKSAKLAVVAVLMDIGVAHPGLKTIWDWLPEREGPEQIIGDLKINALDLLPLDREHYWHFDGSLTTPPCSEGVKWFVLKQKVTISPEQLRKFTRLLPFNARPVQALNGRDILEN
jgi:carbonic anhydrase